MIPRLKQLITGQTSLSTPAHTPAQTTGTSVSRSQRSLNGLSYLLTGIWATIGGLAVVWNSGLIQTLERQTQTFMIELRGPVPPPPDVVILAIDEDSLSQEQSYRDDPQKLAYLEPLQAWPWKRAAYAQAIERLMAAGARAVALDIIFATPSSYGPEDDARFQQTLKKYGDRIVLAANYENVEGRQGSLTQLTYPTPAFRLDNVRIGSINYWPDVDGRIHQLGSEFPRQLAALYPEQAPEIKQITGNTPSFVQATLKAAQLRYINPQGNQIFYYGPAGTFEQIPFWHVLDPTNWNTYLNKGEYFKDKVVLIGGTAPELQDFHPAPFSRNWRYPEPMSGVEIHANALATLLEDRTIREAVPDLPRRGLLVFLGLLSTGLLLRQFKLVWVRSVSTLSILILWGITGYVSLTYTYLYVPTAIPLLAIVCNSLSQGLISSISERRGKVRLRQSLRQYASSPIVQEIISQHDDLQDLVQEREQELMGVRLGGRYRIVKVLGAGGFGETYIAEDNQRPGNPQCVVKQLRAVNHSKNPLLARRLFQKEAETLERLGKHDRIPQLLAYFEENQEFYLVQELIEGHPLNQELPLGKQIPEMRAIQMLEDLLETLSFVHSQGVIHRDIKPSNIIRRKADNALVLIDFGAVKEIRTQLSDGEDKQPSLTIGIGTRGYTPVEQTIGNPRFNSDIYALGMTIVRALTGLPPDKLQEDPDTNTILWQARAVVSDELEALLSRMVHQDFQKRYQSVAEVQSDLQPLVSRYNTPLPLIDLMQSTNPGETSSPTLPIENSAIATEHWMPEPGSDSTSLAP
ncbi:MAG: serine/threonine-protein kinase [Leptolyngbyaceae cyanobacterium bins.59]|nr:serine/threonine-protein kinase [Leptolyngbyaceae cyanobacterium bins.59]